MIEDFPLRNKAPTAMDHGPDSKSHFNARHLFTAVKLVLLALVLWFVGQELLNQFGRLDISDIDFHAGFLVASLLASMAAVLLFIPLYSAIQRSIDCQVGYFPAILVGLVSPLGKYLPGKVASVAGALMFYRSFGVGIAQGTAILYLASAAGFAALALILGPYLYLGGLDTQSIPFYWVILCVWLGSVILAVPQIFIWCANLAMRLVGRPPVFIAFRLSHYLKAVAWAVGQGLLIGSAFWLIARGLAPLGVEVWYLMLASLMAAAAIGLVAFFAPAGIGVREGLLLTFLAGVLTGPVLAVAVVVLRLVQMLSEVILALAALAIWQWHKARNSP